MDYLSAVNDFFEARRRASTEQIVARLTGRSADLLSYEKVRADLKARTSKNLGLGEIPLEAIVGSVGRYTDFTRSFLPKQDSDKDRWAQVQMAVTNLSGLPPIDVCQIGEVYFVQDGNHRVSVARQFGATHIQAYITEIETRVPLAPDVRPDELILKARYADFLEQTDLDRLRPGADLSMTSPGRYRTLKEHIDVHRYFMGLEQEREIPYREAVAHWYDTVYLPVVEVIRERGILRDFPGRTETDLYLWLAEHRAELEAALGWEIETEAAADDLAARRSPKPRRVAARVGSRIADAVTPDGLEDGPPAGQWRRERLTTRPHDRLFADILVPVSGEEAGWQALEQALEVARCEDARLRGLYVVPSKDLEDAARAIQAEFLRRCEKAGVPGQFAIKEGKIARQIVDLARWIDLVVVNLAHPPAPQPVAKLGSGFRTLLRRSPRPVLAVPGPASPLTRALLAYDGSPKADEALFIAAYLAGRWGTALTVVTQPQDHRAAAGVTAHARRYLAAHGVESTFVQEPGPAAEVILKTADEQSCDLILMGSYGHSPVVELALGSAVDQVLRQSRQPVLICR